MSEGEFDLIKIIDSLQYSKNQFEEAANCLHESMNGIHKRLERIELWMKSKERQKQDRSKLSLIHPSIKK